MNYHDSSIDDLSDIVCAAAESLRVSLDAYWPTHGSTGAHERNLSLHLAHAFLSRNYSVYGEGHGNGSTHMRYDLIALSNDPEQLVVAEFKLLWTTSAAQAMREDLGRLHGFRPVVRDYAGDLTRVPRYGVLGAFAYQESFVAPFRGDVPPRERSSKDVVALLRDLPAGAAHGAIKLGDAYGKTPQERYDGLWFVFAIFRATDAARP